MYMYVSIAPSPIDVDSIEIMQLHNKNIRITWKVCKYVYALLLIVLLLQPPEIDTCSMLAIKHYDVRITSSKGEVISEKVDNTTVVFDHLDNHSAITYTVSITVVDIKGQRSITTVTEMTIGTQNITILGKH